MFKDLASVNWLQPLTIIVLDLLVTYWFYRLWKKTGDAAYLWLIAGLGVVPILKVTAVHAPLIYYAIFPSPPPAQMTPSMQVHRFFLYVVECMGFGCVFMGFGRLANGRVPFRELLFAADDPQREEEVL